MAFGLPLIATPPPYVVSVAAGSDWVGDGGPGLRALLFQAEGLAVDGSGNVYIADAAAHRIRKVTPTGVIQTIAGTGRAGFSGDGGPATEALLNAPYGVAVDAAQNVYIADLGNRRVRRVDRSGKIDTVAGGGTTVVPQFGSIAGADATLAGPRSLTTDAQGNLYIVDFAGHRVLSLSTDGLLVAVAGTGVAGTSPDESLAQTAKLAYPTALAIDAGGSLVVADSGNHLTRRIELGAIRTIVEGGNATGLDFDRNGTLYVADAAAGRVLKIPAKGPSSTITIAARDVAIALDGTQYFANGDAVWRRVETPSVFLGIFAGGASRAAGDYGPATDALLNQPTGVAADASGNVYLADRDNHRIRRIGIDGVIATVAGSGMDGFGGDGGPAAQASLSHPAAVSVDGLGNLFIADTGNGRIRRVRLDGRIETAAQVAKPLAVQAGPDGSHYVISAEPLRLLRITPGGLVSTVTVDLSDAFGTAMDDQGNLYVADTAAHRVMRVDAAGAVTDLAPGKWGAHRGVAWSAPHQLYVTDLDTRGVFVLDLAAEDAEPVALAFETPDGAAVNPMDQPWAIAAAPGGVFYAADPGQNRAWKLTPMLDPARLVEVVHAATLESGPLAPGLLLRIRGLAIEHPGIEINRVEAKIVSADPDRQEFVVLTPELAGSTATLEIRDADGPGGDVLWSKEFAVQAAAPGLFTDEAKHVLAANEDGSINRPDNPAARGSIAVLYGTGIPFPGAVPGSVAVRIAGIDAQVLYAGPVSGSPGVFQINIRIPAGYLPPGEQPVVVSSGLMTSPAGVTVCLK